MARGGLGLRHQPTLGHRQAGGGEDLLGLDLVHGHRRGQHARVGVGDPQPLQQALHAAVLAPAAVERVEHDVGARVRKPPDQVRPGVDLNHGIARGPQRGCALGARDEGDLALGRPAAQQHRDAGGSPARHAASKSLAPLRGLVWPRPFSGCVRLYGRGRVFPVARPMLGPARLRSESAERAAGRCEAGRFRSVAQGGPRRNPESGAASPRQGFPKGGGGFQIGAPPPPPVRRARARRGGRVGGAPARGGAAAARRLARPLRGAPGQLRPAGRSASLPTRARCRRPRAPSRGPPRPGLPGRRRSRRRR